MILGFVSFVFVMVLCNGADPFYLKEKEDIRPHCVECFERATFCHFQHPILERTKIIENQKLH